MPTDTQELKKIKLNKENSWKKDWKQNKVVYFIFIPVLAYFILVSYLPMFGIATAFMDYRPIKGFSGSAWVGWANFRELFLGETFPLAIRNTVIMALLNLSLAFVAPIVFALIVSSLRFRRFRRVIQTISYFPNFIAAVVVVELLKNFLGENGAITSLLSAFGLEKQDWLYNPNPPVFWLIYCFSGIWQGFGFGSILFVGAIANISGDYYEAAAIDGANRWQVMWKITIPSILPIVIMLLVIQVGVVFRTGFDRVLLMQGGTNFDVSENIYTYTYRYSLGGAGSGNYGISSASGLFQSVVSMILLVGSNWLSRKLTTYSLF